MRTLLILLTLAMTTGCTLHDRMTSEVKRKAVVHFNYDYDDASDLDQVQAVRLFIFNEQGQLYRDTLLTRDAILSPDGAMQTYISNGHYTFISWANIGPNTTVAASGLSTSQLEVSPSGADILFYGQSATHIEKGDSLIFDVTLFKSVFKVNVKISGMNLIDDPKSHYFGLTNHRHFDFMNSPNGDMELCTPQLTMSEDGNLLSGSFYTPYFNASEDLTVGVYTNNPNNLYTTLAEATIQDFAQFTQEDLGRDVEITVSIKIHDLGVSIIITDWDGQIIQTTELGK